MTLQAGGPNTSRDSGRRSSSTPDFSPSVRHSLGWIPIRLQAGSLFVFLLFVVMWLYAEQLRWRAAIAHKEHQGDTELDVLVDKKPGGARTPPRSPRSPHVTQQSTGFVQEHFLKLIALDHETLHRNRENLRHVVEMGTIVLWLYVADRTSIISAGPKEYIRDVFLFIFLVLTIVASSYSTTQGRTPRLINRQQTEEWKGWMQVLFLLYHYYEAREVYNAIRVFIASYVWMTGFGNFAYYHKTRDFSAGRFAQMMWRLNLLAFVCCMALDNQYMLYYIWYVSFSLSRRSPPGGPGLPLMTSDDLCPTHIVAQCIHYTQLWSTALSACGAGAMTRASASGQSLQRVPPLSSACSSTRGSSTPSSHHLSIC